ncbi:cysteine-rich CWC family protein [Cohnella sp. GCM10027633]|uniref:cysteine-rich CWC family protein n=1 Tax=unclassified Cohnella TaxID=2636738 RepID=UPI0036268408
MSGAANCPLCGREGECGVASGKLIEDCWCAKASFPPGLLARVPAESRDRACICQACAEKHRETGADTEAI